MRITSDRPTEHSRHRVLFANSVSRSVKVVFRSHHDQYFELSQMSYVESCFRSAKPLQMTRNLVFKDPQTFMSYERAWIQRKVVKRL